MSVKSVEVATARALLCELCPLLSRRRVRRVGSGVLLYDDPTAPPPTRRRRLRRRRARVVAMRGTTVTGGAAAAAAAAAARHRSGTTRSTRVTRSSASGSSGVDGQSSARTQRPLGPCEWRTVKRRPSQPPGLAPPLVSSAAAPPPLRARGALCRPRLATREPQRWKGKRRPPIGHSDATTAPPAQPTTEPQPQPQPQPRPTESFSRARGGLSRAAAEHSRLDSSHCQCLTPQRPLSG